MPLQMTGMSPKLPPAGEGGGAAARQRQFEMERGNPVPEDQPRDNAEECPSAEDECRSHPAWTVRSTLAFELTLSPCASRGFPREKRTSAFSSSFFVVVSRCATP